VAAYDDLAAIHDPAPNFCESYVAYCHDGMEQVQGKAGDDVSCTSIRGQQRDVKHARVHIAYTFTIREMGDDGHGSR
jgi:hypothetical protein